MMDYSTNYYEEKEKPKPSKTNYLARYDSLVDIVASGGSLFFLEKYNDEIQHVLSTDIAGETYYPPPRDQLPYSIPRLKEVKSAYDSDSPQELFKDLINYHKKFSELPSEAHYILITAWDFSTYLLESLNYSGYIYLYAVPGRGKTKTGQSAIHVAYRGIHQENVREADLFRASNDLAASIFIDVQNLSKKVERAGSEDILLNRFEKGLTVRRITNYEKGPFKDSRYFEVFGPTIIASNESINEILETRSFPIIMPYSTKNYPKPKPKDGLPFRERLVAFRAHRMEKELAPPRTLVTGRVNDIAAPLGQIIETVAPSCYSDFEELIHNIHERGKMSKAYTVEGEVIKALLDLGNTGTMGKVFIRSIVKQVNEYRPLNYPTTARQLGKILTRLNFEQCPHHGDERAYYYDRELVKRLASEYGLDDSFKSSDVLSQTSQMSHLSQYDSEIWLDWDSWDVRDIEGVLLGHEYILKTDNIAELNYNLDRELDNMAELF